jgi:hypothetical protein
MTSTAPPPVDVTTTTDLCSCEKPAPVEQAAHKGASRTICLNCNLPVKLSL